MPDSLCPVCGHPKPKGLSHCSQTCEERDPEEQEACEGCRTGSIYPSRHTCGDTGRDDWNTYPEPMEGATDGRD